MRLETMQVRLMREQWEREQLEATNLARAAQGLPPLDKLPETGEEAAAGAAAAVAPAAASEIPAPADAADAAADAVAAPAAAESASLDASAG